MVVCGQHGDEKASPMAGERLIENYAPTRGTLIVIPRANPPAIDNLSRGSSSGDMNRSWSEPQPRHTAARAIWDVIEEVDADLVFDLHTSNGIYSAGSGVGQCIFPTASARSDARAAISWTNDNVIGRSMRREHGNKIRFSLGNTQSGGNPLLSHMVGRERSSTKGFLIESWRIPHVLEPRVEMILRPTVWLLERNGVQFD